MCDLIPKFVMLLIKFSRLQTMIRLKLYFCSLKNFAGLFPLIRISSKLKELHYYITVP